MTKATASGNPHQEAQVEARKGAKQAESMRPTRRETHKGPRVPWYATLLIVLMLVVGAGWELWRWLLLFITMD